MGQIRIHLSKQGVQEIHLASSSPEEERFLFQLYRGLQKEIEGVGKNCRRLAMKLEKGEEVPSRTPTK